MADTLTRLSGPQSPVASEAGSTIYTPKSGQTVAVKNAVISNPDPLRGGWIYLSLGAMTTTANRIIPGIYIPPNTVQTIPLDFIMNGGTETLVARQVADMSYTKMSIATAVAVVNSTTDGTSYATASWSSTANRPLILVASSTHGSAATDPSSITDTHSGLTWTFVNSAITADSTQHVSVYRGMASGTTNTTTTVNYSTTRTSGHIVIAELTNSTSGGTQGSEAIQDAGDYRFPTTSVTSILHPGDIVCGARFYAFASTAGGTSTPGAGFTELSDAAIATPTSMMTTEYAFSPGGTADLELSAAATQKIGVLINLQDGTLPLTIMTNGVVIS